MAQSDAKFVKVLDKGLVTLPKTWRTALDLKKGTVLKAKKMNHQIVIEPFISSTAKTKVPYRIYNTKELRSFIQSDQLK